MKTFTILLVISTFVALAWSAGDCPPSNQMIMCSPKCKSDADCSAGTKCCPNVCHEKSCSSSAQYRSGSGSGHKGSKSTATGTYCGNAKCNSHEKCELDKTTKRQKCVRK